MIYGLKTMGTMNRIIKILNFGVPLPFGLINNKRSFISIDNLVNILICCIKHPNLKGKVFLVCDGEDMSTQEFFKNISQVAMTIINELEKTIPKEEQTKYAQTDPLSFIERYCSKLSVPTKYTKLAQFIAMKIKKNNLIPENTPYSIAAGIIYFISQEFQLNITKKDIQLISDTSEVTINKCYRKIDTMKKDLIPPCISVA